MRLLLSCGFAAPSKPRCGSTSLRRALDPFLDPTAGDMAIDRAGQKRPFHPHITGPALRSLTARIFEVEAPALLEDWLSDRLNTPISLPALNGTNGSPPPPLGEAAMDRVRAMFRWEARHYGI